MQTIQFKNLYTELSNIGIRSNIIDSLASSFSMIHHFDYALPFFGDRDFLNTKNLEMKPVPYSKYQVIQRVNAPTILKRQIEFESLPYYEDIPFLLLEELLQDTIEENTYSTIDLLTLIKDNFQGSVENTIANLTDFSKVRFNCCWAMQVLYKKLKSYGIDAKVITFKADNFSSKSGDSFIKEAHMALLIPTRKDHQICYILLDPGIRIPKPIIFSEQENTTLTVDHDTIMIQYHPEEEYKYSMKISGYNRYSGDTTCYEFTEFFNIDYETLNPLDVLFPFSYQLLSGYTVRRFSGDAQKRCTIKLMTIQGTLECYNSTSQVSLSFSELRALNKKEVIQILKPFAENLHEDVVQLVDTILFIVSHHEEFLNQMNPIVLKEFGNL